MKNLFPKHSVCHTYVHVCVYIYISQFLLPPHHYLVNLNNILYISLLLLKTQIYIVMSIFFQGPVGNYITDVSQSISIFSNGGDKHREAYLKVPSAHVPVLSCKGRILMGGIK